jgi:hypothetical protein
MDFVESSIAALNSNVAKLTFQTSASFFESNQTNNQVFSFNRQNLGPSHIPLRRLKVAILKWPIPLAVSRNCHFLGESAIFFWRIGHF